MKQTKKQRKSKRSSDSSAGWRKVAQATVLSTIGVLGAAAGAQTLPMPQTEGPKGTENSLAAENVLPARPGNGASTPAGQDVEQHPQRFDIPAGDLAPALEAFTRATGLHVHTSVPADKLATFHTKGAQGDLAPEHALHHLLEDTGLDGWISTSDTVEIAIRSTEHVEVTGEAGQVTLQQFPQPLLDTAQTVTQVPEYILSEQADTTLRDTLRNVPGISIAAGEGGAQGDNLTIRGFSARNDIFLDGIRDFGSYYRDSFNYSAVDVLEGPASVEFGRGSTGGVVNQETKQPEERNFVVASGQFGTNAMRRGTLDANHQLKAIPGGSETRINIVGEEAGVAGRDITNVKRFGVAPSLSFGLDTKTRTSLNYLHEAENDIPDYGLPYFGNAVPNVPHNTYYGLANANFLKTTPDVLTAKVDHDFGSAVTVRNSFRWANYQRVFRITEPQINSVATAIYSNTDGSTAYEGANTKIQVQCAIVAVVASSCYPFNTPSSQVMVKRNQINGISTEDMLWDQVSAAMHFAVHHINNSAMVLVEGGRERSNPNRPAYTLPYTTLLNPNPYDAFAPTATTPGVTTHVASQSYGIDFLDTMEINRWLQLSGGVRFDYFSTTSNTPQNGTTAAASGERLDKQPTYRAAVVVKPRTQGSVYFDWGTSFNPSAESLSLSGNNAISPPEYNETFELGAKWDFLHDRLNLNGSVFRTEKLNARETDPTNSNNIVNSGNQLVRGVQIGALGHMPASFDLIVGYAYLDGEVEKSILNASPFSAVNTLLIAAKDPRANTAPFFISPKSYPLANVPKNSGNLWVTHKLFYGFVGGFGGNYVGARRASSSALIGVYHSQLLLDPATVALVPKALGGYASLNLMVKRPIGEHLNLQVNIVNLTNAFFIDQPHPNHLVPGEGRNAQFGITYKF